MAAGVPSEPTLPAGVVEDLAALAAVAQETLQAAGCLLVKAPLIRPSLEDAGLGVEFNGELDTLLALVEHTKALLVYVDDGTWTEQEVKQLRENLDEADLGPQELAEALDALSDSERHVGEIGSLVLSVVVGVVVHTFTFLAAWYYRVESAQPQTVLPGRESRVSDWLREYEEDKDQRLKADAALADLVGTLLTDESFLCQTSAAARRTRADELALPLIGEVAMSKQRVRGVIAKAATAAGVRRLAEVVPVRTEALRARLPDLAAALSSEPDFVSARANNVRERCARAMLTREDPVVPATPLIAALVATALAILKDRRVTKMEWPPESRSSPR